MKQYYQLSIISESHISDVEIEIPFTYEFDYMHPWKPLIQAKITFLLIIV